MNHTPSAPGGGPERDEAVERLLRLAGPREAAPPERVARMRAATHEAWRQSMARRRQRYWILAGSAGLATAAAVFVAIAPGRVGLGRSAAPAAEMPVVAQVVTATGAFSLNGGMRTGDTIRAGQSLTTGDAASAALALVGGGELRLDAGTAVTLLANREIALDRGGIYLDSGTERGGAPVTVRTPIGVVRDIGTRFETRLVGADVRVRVRDGAVRVERGAVREEAAAGIELLARADGRTDRRAIPRHGVEWDWVARAAPPFRVEGQPLSSLLAWVAHEGGWTVTFADPAVEIASRTTIVHGSIEGLTPVDALDVVLPTCGLTRRVSGDRVIVERLREQNGGRR